MPQLIDLSMPIEANPADATFEHAHFVKHEAGGDLIWRALFFPPKASLWQRFTGYLRYWRNHRWANRHSFPDGMFLSNEIYTISVHCGTHLDAPYHYGPLSEGKPARRIDEIPLDWCFGQGVVLDLTHKGQCELITISDLQKALHQAQYELKPMDIVLIRTDSDMLWPRREYFTNHPAMSVEATHWLVEQGIKMMGIDTNGFDLPFMKMIKSYLDTKDPSVLWPTHVYGRHHEYIHMERLANLRQLPLSHSFQVACFPIAVHDAGAAWVRVVAII